MRKSIMFLILLVLSIPLLAQQDSTAYPMPGSIIDIFSDLKGWFASTATVAGLSIFLTLGLGKIWKDISKIAKQIVAVVIALALVIIGNIANMGFMADFNVLSTIVYGLVIGFMANGWYDLKNAVK